MKKILLLMALAVAGACSRSAFQWESDMVKHRVLVSMNSWEGWAQEAKSSTGEDAQGTINSICALVYRFNGTQYLFDQGTSTTFGGIDDIDLILNSKHAYKVFFIANCDNRVFQTAARYPDLEQSMKAIRLRYSNYASSFRGKGMPMVAAADVAEGSTGDMVVRFTRLYSRWKVALDFSDLKYSSLKVNSLKVCNAPLTVNPMEDRSAITSAAESSGEEYGDSASAEDLERLAAGEEICLYILENMQGDLLGGTATASERIPDGIAAAGHSDKLDGNMLTYIRLNASVDTPWATYANVEYKAFLGDGGVRNFDICRNSPKRLTLKFRSDRVEESEWSITPDAPTRVFDPRLEVSVTTTLNANGAWVPQATFDFRDCEKLDSILGGLDKGIEVGISASSDHYARVDYRDLAVWKKRNSAFIQAGGRLLEPSVYHNSIFVNGSLKESYWSQDCELYLSGYSKEAITWSKRDNLRFTFSPCKDEKRWEADSFHTIINPSNHGSYVVESEFYDGDPLNPYAAWYWSFSPVDYISPDNVVNMDMVIRLPSKLVDAISGIYGKALKDFVSVNQDFSGSSPFTAERLKQFGFKGMDVTLIRKN